MKKFKNTSIKDRLLIGFILVILTPIILGVTYLSLSTSINKQTDNLDGIYLPQSTLLSKIRIDILESKKILSTYTISYDESLYEEFEQKIIQIDKDIVALNNGLKNANFTHESENKIVNLQKQLEDYKKKAKECNTAVLAMDSEYNVLNKE